MIAKLFLIILFFSSNFLLYCFDKKVAIVSTQDREHKIILNNLLIFLQESEELKAVEYHNIHDSQKLKTIDEDEYFAIILINIGEKNQYEDYLKDFLEHTIYKDRILLMSFFSDYGVNQYVIESQNKSNLSVDTIITTTKRNENITWKSQFGIVYKRAINFLLDKI